MREHAAGLKVVFAGSSHAHAALDARHLAADGAEIVAVWDPDAPAVAAAQAAEHGARYEEDLDALLDGAELVIGTTRTSQVPHLVAAAAAHGVPLFANKTIAATVSALDAIEEARGAAAFATSSVLRFAPAVPAFRDRLRADAPLALSVLAQHSIAGFLTEERSWQDEPRGAGGTAVNIGVHAWELLDAVLPDDPVIEVRSARRRWIKPRRTASEDLLVVHARTRSGVPVDVRVAGVAGPDAYRVESVSSEGIHTLDLDVFDPMPALGFRATMRAAAEMARTGVLAVPWERSRAIYENALEAARIARR